MLLSHIKTNFITHLKGDYPREEVSSFFNILMEYYLGKSRLDLALQPQMEISSPEEKKFEKALHQLKQHIPIQYILGETEFFGLKLRVNPNVLIPRPETEELVEWILEDFQKKNLQELSILDIGTGSGCIAVSLAKNLPKAKIVAMDISEEALDIARYNAEHHDVNIQFMKQDVLALKKLPGAFDIIVSNPPYVRELEKSEMHRNVLDHEPEMALYVKDDDALIFYKKITKLAVAGLKKNGNLYFEINQYLGKETGELLIGLGLHPELRKDIFGNYRMLKGSQS